MGDFRSGFVSLIGRPNVGKSTLLNQITGSKLAITSPKPQTTRHLIRAIYSDEEAQIVFFDTPGMHQPKNKLGDHMVSAIRQAIAETDIILLLIEANFDPRVSLLEKRILTLAGQYNKKVVLVINKIDASAKERLLPLIDVFKDIYPFASIVPISAKKGDGVELLISELKKLLPKGPTFFPVDTYTDQTEKMLAAELIREQLLKYTHDEIPHGTAVAIESFQEFYTEGEPKRRKHVSIEASILCEKNTHKGIIIGKQGQKLKIIGTNARKEIEAMLGCGCYLDIFVKIREDWRNRVGILHDLGFHSGN